METTAQIAQHFRGVYFGGNWTASNLKDNLADVTLRQATTKVLDFNTIATLVYHINYYVRAVTKVLEGQALDANDKFSFDVPDFTSEIEWQNFLKSTFEEGEKFASLVEKIPTSKLNEFISEEKYGTYYRNLHGIIEHAHYHLGQIALIKKLIQNKD